MSNVVELPFPAEKLEPKSLSNRFWGSEPKRNAFARAKNIMLSGRLDVPTLRAIIDEYNGNLCEEYAYEWKQLLEEIAYAIARDGELEEYERNFIRAYTEVLQINKDTAAACYKLGASRAYTDLVIESLGDGEDGLSDEAMGTLNAIATHLGIKPETAKGKLIEQLTVLVTDRLNALLEDGMLSDEEWRQYESYRSKLRLGAVYSESDLIEIEAARNRWRCEFGELRPIELSVSCKLKKNETAYFEGVGHWHETRSNRGEQEWKLIAEGRIIMTDQRVIMLAEVRENKSVSWGSLLSVTKRDLNTFELEKARGKSPVIRVYESDITMEGTASSIAYRLFSEYQS